MTLPDPEFEAECIRRILAGEKHLFHDLIRPCERSIYFLLLALLKNETDAEDAAQETVIKVYQNLDKFRGDSQFRTWVLSIARNEGLGRLRKEGNGYTWAPVVFTDQWDKPAPSPHSSNAGGD